MRRVGGTPNDLQYAARVDLGPFASSHLSRTATARSPLARSVPPANHRHGSGAGTDPMDTGFRRRKPRSPSPDRGRTNFQPGGPITAGEWTDQIDGLQQQIQSLNKIVSDHACVIGKLKSELEQSTVPAIVQRIEALERSVNQRFEDGGNTINRKHDVLQAELRAFAVQLQQIQQQPPKPPDQPPGMETAQPNGAEQYRVSTPPRAAPPNDNPFYMPGTGVPGMPQTFNGFGQPGEAPRTPNHPTGQPNNSADFGLDSVSLSG